MIIEFTGVPCSGKSAISHELVKLLMKDGHTVCEKQYLYSHNKGKVSRISSKIFSALFYCIRHPKKAIFYYKTIASKRLWLNYISLITHRCDCEFCVLEQGYLQFFGSMLENKEYGEQELKEKAEALLPKQKIIQVIVTACDETVLRRACARVDKPYFMSLNHKEQVVHKAAETVERLRTEWIVRYGADWLIDVPNEDDGGCQIAAENLLKIIKRMELI